MTGIQWTEQVWNPTSGCDKVSPGCGLPRFPGDDTGGCYAMAMAKRLKGMGSAKYQNDGDPKTSGPGFGITEHPDALDIPLRWRTPRKVFVNSMSDLFHSGVSDEFIARVWAVMAATPQHTYQVLTKRHGRMQSLIGGAMDGGQRLLEATTDEATASALYDTPWPLPNVHLGVSVEDQKRAELRVPALEGTAAAVRFLSCEPLLGPVDLTPWMPPGRANWQCQGCRRIYSGEVLEACPGCGRIGYWTGSYLGDSNPNGQPLGWVIVGGESGPGARPMELDWARSLVQQCQAAEVAVFVKQLGSAVGRTLGDGKGGDPDFWPEDLRVRQFPAADHAEQHTDAPAVTP